MRRWLALLLLWGTFALPSIVQAQSPIKLSMLQVQLWPEYDQPSMLVIYDFRVPDSVKLPVSVSLNLPKDAHLVAVASQAADGSLLNTDYTGPIANDPWQAITIQIQTATTYHIEYYQALSKTGQQRQFTYVWPGEYAIDDLSISLRVPPDTTSIVTNPEMKSSKAPDGTANLIKDFGPVAASQQFQVQVTYTKTSDTLSVPQESVQPSKPLGSNTPGRIVWSNYLPYILGGLVVAGLGGTVIYLLQPHSQRPANKHRSRKTRAEASGKSEIYCHQCGARAQPGDRFCRVCGTSLRLGE